MQVDPGVVQLEPSSLAVAEAFRQARSHEPMEPPPTEELAAHGGLVEPDADASPVDVQLPIVCAVF